MKENKLIFVLCVIFLLNYGLNYCKNNQKSKNLYMSFGSNFNDTLSIFLNNKLVKRDYYITNNILGICLVENSDNYIKEYSKTKILKLYVKDSDKIKILNTKNEQYEIKITFKSFSKSLIIFKNKTYWSHEFITKPMQLE